MARAFLVLYLTQERVRAFGLLFWAANLGFTVSTVAAGVLVQQGYGILFWINAAASVLAALIVWRHVPETRPSTPEATRRALLPVLLRDRLMLAMAAIHVVYFTMFLQTFSTLPLVMAGDGHGPGTFGAVLALNGIVIVVVQPIAVRLLDGRDTASVLAVSMLLVGIGGGLGAVVQSGAGHAGSILVWTLGHIGVSVMFGAPLPTSRRPTCAAVTWASPPPHGAWAPRAGAAARHRTARPRRANRAVGGMLGDRDRAVRRAAGCRPGPAPPNLRPGVRRPSHRCTASGSFKANAPAIPRDRAREVVESAADSAMAMSAGSCVGIRPPASRAAGPATCSSARRDPT